MGDKDPSIPNYPFQIRSLGLVLCSCALLAVGQEPQSASKKTPVVKLYMVSWQSLDKNPLLCLKTWGICCWCFCCGSGSRANPASSYREWAPASRFLEGAQSGAKFSILTSITVPGMCPVVTPGFQPSVGTELMILLVVCHLVFAGCSVRALNLIKYTVHFLKCILGV